ncbi:MAG: polysaccharide biosynthesis tyrosine autokinase, partial [Candidatus Tectomicrobia bacterium]|nr:polysaccharide biosynthesis tyrosine autokinase [Candidatus Tectomicrobia bacterium]
MGQYDINLRDYWRIIRKRKIIIIFTVMVLGFFSFVFAKLNEPAPIYSASSAVRIEQNTALSGLVSESASLGAAAEITTQTAVIRSYPVMEQVAKELGMVDKSLKSDDIAKNSRLVSVINGLAGQVNTSQVGDTNIISITVTSGDPDQAARMANTTASVFRQFDYENRNQTVLRQHEFIKGQLTQSEERLKESEKVIKEFKEAKNFLSIAVEATSVGRVLERLQEVVSEQQKALKRIREAVEQVRNIRDVRAGRTERVPVDDIDPGLARLNQQLVELQVQRDNLLQEFTAEHPSVSDILQQINNVVRQMLLILEGREKTLADLTRARRQELATIESRNKEIPDLSLQLQRHERLLATNQEVHNLLRQKFEEVSIRLAGTQHLVRIVKPAFRPLGRDNPPQIFLNTFVGALLGLVVGLAFALVLETMDTSIGTIEDVEAYLEVPVLGVIPILDNEELERQYIESNPERAGRFTPDIYGRLVTHFVPRSPIAEAYRSFRTQMEFVSVEKGGNTFLITSSTPGEGETTTSINFAITCAQSNKRTLLIDADMRKPVIYRIFGIDREPGLTDILLGNNKWADCVRTMTDIMLGKFDMEDIMLTPGLDNLNLLTCGHIPPNPSEILNSTRMTQFLEEIRQEFDVIVIDTPPVLPVTDAAILGTRVDGCVLVYRVGTIARGALKRAKMQLDNVRAKVWGVVLNSMRPEATSDIDSIRYQSSYYYGGYT